MVLEFSYRVTRAPSGRVRVGIDCAGECEGLKDLTAEFQAAAGSGWRTGQVRLAELGLGQADLRTVVVAFALESDGPLQIHLSEVSLSASGGDAPGDSQPRPAQRDQ